MKEKWQRFREECINEFGFLIDDYGFKLQKSCGRSTKFCCEFISPLVGITIIYEMLDPNPYVIIQRLTKNKIENMPVFIKPETKLRSFYLTELLVLRGATKEEIAMLTRGPSRRPRKSQDVLASNAIALRKYADDILRGSLEAFDQLEMQVVSRSTR